MDVVLKALLLIKHMYGEKKIHKTTYVLFSDTLMEMDPVIDRMQQQTIDGSFKTHEFKNDYISYKTLH